jgi:SAM-dependent methyltransferase
MRLDLTIHPNDQMLLHSLRYFDANTAVSQYFNVALQQYRAAQQVLRGFFPSGGSDFRMLDFACGYGRLLRFLTLSVPPEQVWASEIQLDALDFVKSRFGVHAVASSAQPGVFDPGVKFDFIWVASLFSHLPHELFHRWLARLLALLKPDGVLAFSVHDAALWPGSVPETGFVYTPQSENPDLDSRIYGTTFVTEAFVRSAVSASVGHACTRLVRGIANEQDVYVVSARDPTVLDGFRRGPWGFVDIVRVSPDRELYLTGWAASLDEGPLGSVRVALDGDAHDCPISSMRPDVGETLQDKRLDRSGWQMRRRLSRASTFLEVSAASARGETALLYAGQV